MLLPGGGIGNTAACAMIVVRKVAQSAMKAHASLQARFLSLIEYESVNNRYPPKEIPTRRV
jgi:hypothetical protein